MFPKRWLPHPEAFPRVRSTIIIISIILLSTLHIALITVTTNGSLFHGHSFSITSSCRLITGYISYKDCYVTILIKQIDLQTACSWHKQYYMTAFVTCTDCNTAGSFLVYLAHTIGHYTDSLTWSQAPLLLLLCTRIFAVRTHTFHNNIWQLSLASYHIWALWHQTGRFNDSTLLEPNKTQKMSVYGCGCNTQHDLWAQSTAIGKSALYGHTSHNPMSLYTTENE